MKTFAELIDTLTERKLAEILKVNIGHIKVMRCRNSIPQDYWPALVKLGISLDKLVQLRKAAFPRKRR